MKKPIYIAISREELAILNTSRLGRLFSRAKYPLDLHSGREVREYAALAANCRGLGASLVDTGEIEQLLRSKERVIKLGRTDLECDIQMLTNTNSESVWNADNLEKVFYWDRYLKPSRKLWSAFIGSEGDLETVSRLFDEHGRLFIKTRTKGNSRMYENHKEFVDALGDISLLISSSRDLIISEPIEIATIEAKVDGQMQCKPDEFRHYIICGELIATTRAFDCDAPDLSSAADHIARVKEVMVQLSKDGFANTYVLDTCRLSDQSIAEIEINNLFSAGIYDFSAIPKLAKALVNS